MAEKKKEKVEKVAKLFDWLGGKRWLRVQLSDLVSKALVKNNQINYWIEPFAGGLGSFEAVSAVLAKHNIKKVYLNDVNYVLINFYRCVKSDHLKCLSLFEKIENEYIGTLTEKSKTLNKTRNKEEMRTELVNAHLFYVKIRDQFNQQKKLEKDLDYDLSAMFLFLQAHCFNGVYRENSSGEHNVGFNWDSKIISVENKKKSLIHYQELFNRFDIEFVNKNYSDFLAEIPPTVLAESLIYLDPPYVNSEERSSENKYSKNPFRKKEQNELLGFVSKHPFVIYSNHDLPEIREKLLNFDFLRINRTNHISAGKDRDAEMFEILAYKF